MNFDSADDREDVDKVIEAFDNFCIGEINVSYERYVLNQRIQDKNESFDNFLSEVRRLIKSCDFGALTDSIIRDRIICGIKDETTRQKLLQIRKLDLAKAIDICRSSETAQRHLREMRPSAEVSQVKTSSRHHSTRSTRQPRSTTPFRERAYSDRSQSRTPQQARQCKFCNKAHEFKKTLCPAYNKVCNICQEMNHFRGSVVCRGRPGKKRVSNIYVDEDDNHDVYSDEVMTIHREKSYDKKIYAHLNVGKIRIKFLLDTGASVNVLPLHLAEQVLGDGFQLETSNTTLRQYNNAKLPCVGLVKVDVKNPKTQARIQRGCTGGTCPPPQWEKWGRTICPEPMSFLEGWGGGGGGVTWSLEKVKTKISKLYIIRIKTFLHIIF